MGKVNVQAFAEGRYRSQMLMTEFNKDRRGENSDLGKNIMWIKARSLERMPPLKNCIQFNKIDAKS